MTLSVTMLCRYDLCHYAGFRVLFIVKLSVIMLSAIMLSVIMLSVIMPGVIMPGVVALSKQLEPAKQWGHTDQKTKQIILTSVFFI
jgi:hypothetical protein